MSTPVDTAGEGAGAASSAKGVITLLAAAQFLMALDTSVMNVSIASVAEDVGTTVTGVQTAITLYTLVMASLMITGGKLGAIFGRKKVFTIGIVIYAVGSLTTAAAPSLSVLILGWSGLEGIGAALIMPAIVALVAANVEPAKRTAAYGTIAAAGAMAVAVGPIIGGAVATSFSWRWVFVAEVFVAIVIVAASRRITDVGVERGPRLDPVGIVLSIVGLAAVVLGFLKSSEWGWVTPKTDGPRLLGLSPVVWLVLGGLFVLWLLMRWLRRVKDGCGEPLFDPALLSNERLTGGLSLFGTQFFMQSGIFFTIPLFLSVVLGLSAFQTGLRLLPLSIGLLLAAAGVPKLFPDVSPRRVVRIGVLLMLAGTAVLIGGLDVGANAAIVFLPLLLVGLGIGSLSSQLGAVVVSSVPESEAPAVGGLQNTVMNLGASLGTALVGSLLVAALASSLATGIAANPAVPETVKQQATVQLEGGMPFLSDAQLSEALDRAGVTPAVADEIVSANADARYDGLRVGLVAVMLVGILALFLSGRLPERQAGGAVAAGPD